MTEKEAKSCINTIELLRRLAFNVHGVMDVIDVENCDKIIALLSQEPYEDEYIKVPKKALKYRTAGMVAYNAEWLKNHFDMERAVICGAQEPCGDCISRVDAMRAITDEWVHTYGKHTLEGFTAAIYNLPRVMPEREESEGKV